MKLRRPHTWLIASIVAASLGAIPAQANSRDLETGGKLLLTNGAASVDGSSGGGLATWAVIAGNATEEGIGASAYVTLLELPDYRLQNHGFAIGLFDRVELSYARQNFDTKAVGASLGLGRGFKLNQDIYGAKLRLAGDLVYGAATLPQISIGAQFRKNVDANVVDSLGASRNQDVDFYLSATKLILSHSVLLNGTARLTRANQFGLLGYGGDKQTDRTLEFEASVGYQLSRRLLVGGEYRTKPDNLSLAPEGDAMDLFAAWAINDNFTLTAAYADLGNIVTQDKQRGALLSLQAAF
ncbi:DUF3034 family protein [Sphingorhabdus sp.]|uniref:DUF3034 family protein n=1 Tax=Sphingorhabdus sp. TaxID=1902408 RepID=UPI003982E9DE